MSPATESQVVSPQDESLEEPIEDETTTNPTDEVIDEEIADEDDDDYGLDADDTDDGKKKKRTRKRFSEDNTYVFVVSNPDSKEERLKAQKQAIVNLGKKKVKKGDMVVLENDAETKCSLTYTDHSLVDNFRIHEIIEGAEYDDDGKMTSGKILAYVCSGSSDQAAGFYLADKNIDVNLAFKKRTRGRQATKIEATSLMLGRLLAGMLFNVDNPTDMETGMNPLGFQLKENYDESKKDQWDKLFAPGSGQLAHYLDTDGRWKQATE